MDYELNIKLNAINNATAQINSVASATKELSNSAGSAASGGIGKLGKELESTGSRINVLGQRMSWMVTVPLLGFANSAIETAIKIDTAWIRLDKIWTGTAEQLQMLKTIGEQFSNKFGVDVEKVSQIITDFTSAGIDNVDMLKQMSDITMKTSKLYNIDTAEAFKSVKSVLFGFNLTADQTAQAMADIYAIGIKTTASEEGILNMFTKVAGIARETGYSYQALAASESVFEKNAIPAGRAGNAMKTIIQSLGAVTAKSADIFKKFGLDMKSSQFKTETAEQKLEDLAKVFEKVKLSGDKLNMATLNEGLTKLVGKMQANQLTVLLEDMGAQFDNNADSISQFYKAMDIGADKAGNMAFMDGSLNKVMDEQATKLAQLQEQYRNASARIGNDLLPIKMKLLEVALKLLDAFNNASPAMQKWIVYVGIAAAAAGPLLAIIGLITTTVGFLMSALSGVVAFFSTGFGVTIIAAVAGLSAMTLAIIAITAVVVGFVAALIFNWGGLRDKTVSIFTLIGTWIANKWNEIRTWVITSVTGIWDGIVGVWNSIVNYMQTQLLSDIGFAIGFIVGIIIVLPLLILEGIGNLGNFLWTRIFAPAFNYLIKNIPVWIEKVIQFFRDLPTNIVNALATLSAKVGGVFNNAGDYLKTNIPKWISAVIQFFKDIPKNIESALSDLGSILLGAFKKGFDVLKNGMGKIIDGMSSGLKSAFSKAGLKFAEGGIVPQYFANGGPVYAASGYLARGNDTVPAMLSPGEIVLNSSQQSNLWDILQGKSQMQTAGGPVVNINVGSMIASPGEQRNFARKIQELLTQDKGRQ